MADPHALDLIPGTLIYRREQHGVTPGLTLRAAIESCGIPPELVIAVRDGQVIDHGAVVRPGDRIRLISAIVGG